MSTVVHYDVQDNIAVITLDSPPVNGLGLAVREGIQQGFEQALADTGVEAIVIASAGKIFCGGADITEFGALFGAGEDAITDRILAINLDVFNAFEDLPVPTVAAINGIALGGGFEMALVCDYRVLSETARVGFPETKLGIIPGDGGAWFLPRAVGYSNACKMAFSGEAKLAIIVQQVQDDLCRLYTEARDTVV